MARYLFGQSQELVFYGGYPEAERQMLLYVPEYLDWDSYVPDTDFPLCCIRATFYNGDTPSHKDFLGALMGAGIARETLGDICVGQGQCDFFVSRDICPYVLQSFVSAGRTHLHLEQLPLSQVQIAAAKTQEIRDTVASVRLDAVISSGFRIGRALACEYISAGKAAIDGLTCEKPDKPICEGMKISVRGLGKIKIRQVGGLTKKGRISVVIDRYM